MTAVTYNIHHNLITWGASTAYTVGTTISKNGNAYRALTSGTSGSTGPSGTTSPQSDGTVSWRYLSAIDYTSLPSYCADMMANPPADPDNLVALVWNNNGPIDVTHVDWIPFDFGWVASYSIIRPAPGESFVDTLAADPTKPLRLDTSYGVTFRINDTTTNSAGGTYLNVSQFFLQGFQILGGTTQNNNVILTNYSVVDQCIIDGVGTNLSTWTDTTIPNEGGLINVTEASYISNSLILDRSDTSPTGNRRPILMTGPNSSVDNCTIVGINQLGTGCVLDSTSVESENGGAQFYNCIFTGYNSAQTFKVITANNAGLPRAWNCLFSSSSSGMSYYDSGGNKFLKPAANQFVNATGNFRLLSTSDAIDSGLSNTFATGGGRPATRDIVNFPRTTLWDIGAYEYPKISISITGTTKKPATSVTGSVVQSRATIGSVTKKVTTSLTGTTTISPITGTITATTRKPVTAIMAVNPVATISARTKKPIASIQTIYADAAMPVVPPSRNLAQDQYLTALSALLPSGRFWPKHVTSNLMNVMALYTPALQRLADRGNYLLTDSFPATTGELLPEWEETLGLPDPCWGTDLTLDKRRAQVVARISQLGGQSVAAMNSYAASLGFTTTIKEYSSFKADLNAADGNLTDETYDNAWQMFAPSIGDWRFHADQNYADEALGGFGNDVLRCEINAVAPSHTNVNFVVARRNLLQQTELWGYPWVRSNVNVQKGMTDPLGGNSAYLITANSNATAIFGLTQALTGLTVGSRYTFSVYAKAYNNLDLYINTRVVDSTNSTNRYQMWGRLKTPVSFTTGGSATVTAETDTNQGLDGLWCRYVVSGVIASASTSIQINITNAPSGTTIGGSNGQGFYIWHPQFELGNLPGTTYVPSVDF